MANEVNIQSSLSINKTGHPPYRRQSSFQMDLTYYRGPTPGLLLATTAGVAASLALLSNPGMCWIENLDETNRIEIGTRDTSTGNFSPLIELGPYQGIAIPLARQVGSELSGGAGTGTAGSGCSLWIKAVTASCYCLVEAFER